jgi:hypothetical protein
LFPFGKKPLRGLFLPSKRDEGKQKKRDEGKPKTKEEIT